MDVTLCESFSAVSRHEFRLSDNAQKAVTKVARILLIHPTIRTGKQMIGIECS